MTREEQIRYKAGGIADGDIAHGAPWEDYYQGFIEGARWADANPSKPSLPSDLDEVANKFGFKETFERLREGAITRKNEGMFRWQIEKSFKAGAEWMKEQIIKAF